MSLLFSHTPETLRFILVDPKRVELTLYNGLPHLLTPVITDVQKTINALRWCIGEMERRFEVLAKAGERNIINYNKVMEEKMPYIIFMVDELADLMVAAGAEMEGGIIRLAQMARAVGIHLVLATQRPSVDIITGLIKANIPARIAFSVASLVDSRTILDMAGAEKLLGRGDMLWSPPDMSSPRRLQGAFVSEEEVRRVIDFLKAEEGPQYNDAVVDRQQQSSLVFKIDAEDGDSDPLLDEAKKVIVQAGKASASLLQRRLKVGYARAARLLDLLEAQGFIGPGDGAKPREVLIKTSESNIMTQTQDEEVDEIEKSDLKEEDGSEETF
jgi:S-DNA-T family DNA segregation ATPase FtsK/SpoIIIE